jgi:hypothetical protein
MVDHRDARDYTTTRLRNEADELLGQTKREPNAEARREMFERADLLERTADMLDMASQ